MCRSSGEAGDSLTTRHEHKTPVRRIKSRVRKVPGNSEDVIRSHHCRHVSSDAATAFFSIMPPGAQ